MFVGVPLKIRNYLDLNSNEFLIASDFSAKKEMSRPPIKGFLSKIYLDRRQPKPGLSNQVNELTKAAVYKTFYV